MIGAYLRITLAVAGAVLAVVLFALAFTTAAIIVLALLLIGVVFGRKGGRVFVMSRRTEAFRDHPKVIDHDPDDLKPG